MVMETFKPDRKKFVYKTADGVLKFIFPENVAAGDTLVEPCCDACINSMKVGSSVVQCMISRRDSLIM